MKKVTAIKIGTGKKETVTGIGKLSEPGLMVWFEVICKSKSLMKGEQKCKNEMHYKTISQQLLVSTFAPTPNSPKNQQRKKRIVPPSVDKVFKDRTWLSYSRVPIGLLKDISKKVNFLTKKEFLVQYFLMGRSFKIIFNFSRSQGHIIKYKMFI